MIWLNNLIYDTCFKIGFTFMGKCYPMASFHSVSIDDDPDNDEVSAVIFACDEKTLGMFATRKAFNKANEDKRLDDLREAIDALKTSAACLRFSESVQNPELLSESIDNVLKEVNKIVLAIEA